MTDLTHRAKDRIAVVRQWRGNNDTDAAIMDHLLSEVIALRAEVERLAEALVEAAVPFEGLTLAANMSESNIGLCKGTWDEINNAVAHLREALAAHTQRVNAKEDTQ